MVRRLLRAVEDHHASQEAVSTPRWTATFNHVTPAEIVAGLTTALAHDYAEADAYEATGASWRTHRYTGPTPYDR